MILLSTGSKRVLAQSTELLHLLPQSSLYHFFLSCLLILWTHKWWRLLIWDYCFWTLLLNRWFCRPRKVLKCHLLLLWTSHTWPILCLPIKSKGTLDLLFASGRLVSMQRSLPGFHNNVLIDVTVRVEMGILLISVRVWLDRSIVFRIVILREHGVDIDWAQKLVVFWS